MPLGNGWAGFKTKNPNYLVVRVSVRIIGLEPTRLAAPDPKSGMSTNFTISAVYCGCKDKLNFQFSK